MVWKSWLEQLRRRLIVDPIFNDARSVDRAPLGHDKDWIFHHAIGGGQADFDVPVKDLSARDRVLLYSLFNQKAHIDELIHAFEKLLPDVGSIDNASVIDIGCGPFTGGLALANVVGDAASFRYFGVDRAASMCTFAQELVEGVQEAGQFHANTTVKFETSVANIQFGQMESVALTIFILSYLLASDTVDIPALVAEIVAARKRASMGACIVLYTNSARAGARARFPQFRDEMVASGFVLQVEEIETFTDSDKRRDIHYALFSQPPVAALSIAHFVK